MICCKKKKNNNIQKKGFICKSCKRTFYSTENLYKHFWCDTTYDKDMKDSSSSVESIDTTKSIVVLSK
jgi:hypothetical protein